jgi:hypothetical protein
MIAAMKHLAALLLASVVPAAFAATPCDAPDQFVRLGGKAIVAPGEPLPLVRPYVVGGMAAVSMRDAGGQRWLELAVHSADEARRQLAARGTVAGDPTVAGWRDRVWLRCPSDAGHVTLSSAQ